jgi:hypothetical protein
MLKRIPHVCTNFLSRALSNLPHVLLLLAVNKDFLPHTVSSFRKQTTPFSITVSTPTCDLINIYTLSLPQGRGVRDVVNLLIGETPPLSSAPRITVFELTTLPLSVAQTCQLTVPPLALTRTSDELNGRVAGWQINLFQYTFLIYFPYLTRDIKRMKSLLLSPKVTFDPAGVYFT